MLRRPLVWLLLLLPFTSQATSEQDDWTLERCVDYALSHNISIQQSVLNERLAALTYKQSRLSLLPNLNLNTGYGISYGRSIDPTSNQFVDGHYSFSSLGGQADVLLFGWFQKRNQIAKNDLAHQAAQSDLDQLKDDVSLNVATGFLRALLAREQIGVAEQQVDLSLRQLKQTQSFADAGRVPQLNVAQLSAQVANDSASLIGALADYQSAILDLKALLNLDFETPFSITPPQIDPTSLFTLTDFAPADVFEEAKKHFGSVRGAGLRVKSAKKGYAAAKGGLWPQLSLSAQAGSNYASTIKDYGTPYVDGTMTIGYVDLGSVINQPGLPKLPVTAPNYAVPELGTMSWNKQMENNFRHTYSLNLTVPVFNGWASEANVRQNKINVEAQELAKTNVEIKLRQDVYKAVNDARSSLQKYQAAHRAAQAAQEAYSYAEQRYDLGLSSTVDYLTTKNNQFKAESSLISAKYDLIFRLKVIDYYLGRTLKL
ncbi:MAG: TolC family protein [Bacteroidetes bacterium]|nr:TolC family protein [Bacteroidota bacterium]MBS1630013.1 TolC family protein [Bacteroidota bacterium]